MLRRSKVIERWGTRVEADVSSSSDLSTPIKLFRYLYLEISELGKLYDFHITSEIGSLDFIYVFILTSQTQYHPY